MQILKMSLTLSTPPQPKHLSFTKSSLFHFSLPTKSLSLSPHPNTTPKPLTICMGGGPRTFPGGVSKWQWKRMQAKKAKQLLKARLARERQIYEMRKRAELKSAVAQLERPWEPIVNDESVAKTTTLFSVSADEQVKVLADRFQKPGGFDLWTDNDGPQLFRTNGMGSEGNSAIGFSMRSDNDVKFSGLRKKGEMSGNGRSVRLDGVGSEKSVGFGGREGEKSGVVNGESKGRETSRFINGLGKGKGESLVKFSCGSAQRVESRVISGGSERKVGSRVRFNNENEQGVQSQVRTGGSEQRVGSGVNLDGGGGRRVESRVNNGGSERRVGSRVRFNNGNERRLRNQVRNGGSERRVGSQTNFNGGSDQRVENRVTNGGSELRVGRRVRFNNGNERKLQNQVRNGGNEWRAGSRDRFNNGNERKLQSQVRNRGSEDRFNNGSDQKFQSQVRNGGNRRYDKIHAFKRTDYSESEAYEMSLEQDGGYGYQAKSGEGKASF